MVGSREVELVGHARRSSIENSKLGCLWEKNLRLTVTLLTGSKELMTTK